MGNNKKKILLLNHSADIGGASLSLLTIVRELCKEGCNVHILSPDGPICKDLECMGAIVKKWKPPACYWLGAPIYSSGVLKLSPGYLIALILLPFRLLVAFSLIRKQIQQFGINNIHINSLVAFPLALPLWFIRRRVQIKIIWHIRELLGDRLISLLRIMIVRWIVTVSDDIIAITSNEAAPFLFSKKVTIIYNIVDESWFTNSMKNREVYNQSDIVCMVAGFIGGKGIPDFLKMARIVLQQYPNTQFELYTTQPILVGGMDKIAWKILLCLSSTARWISSGLWEVSELLLDQHIKIFFGKKMTFNDYSHCSIFVNSNEVGAPWGRVIIEAMCAGLPVVATGSSEEFVINGQTGFLVPPGKPELLARQIGILLQNHKLLVSMGDAGHKRAEQLFSHKEYRNKLLSVFDLIDPAV